MQALHKNLAPEESDVSLCLKNFIDDEYNPFSSKCIKHATIEVFV